MESTRTPLPDFEQHPASEDKEMSFLDHLEELRWHLVRAVSAILVFAIGAFIMKGVVFDGIVLAPHRLDFWTYQKLCQLSAQLNLGEALCIKEIGFRLSNIQMSGQFVQHIIVSVAFGIILGFPYLVWELWRFLRPALLPHERKYASGIVFFTSVLFLIGVAFGYFLLGPMSIQFLGNYSISSEVTNEITISSYISTLTTIIFACGIIFELPVAVFFLTKVGLITPESMRTYRKHAILVILMLTAVLTPPDVTSQILLTIPFYGLYEASIYISVMVYKKKVAAEEAAGLR